MDKNELITLFHKELRHEAQTRGYIREETEHVVRHISEFGEKGYIISSYLNEDNAIEVVKDELNYFSNRGHEFEWKVFSYDKPDCLKDILVQEEFTIDDPEALMVMEIVDKHPFLTDDRQLLSVWL